MLDVKPAVQIDLNKFKPRHYQLETFRSIACEGLGKFRKILSIEPRRSGKDFKWWNIMIRAALTWRVGLFLYSLPTFAQARSVIWEGKTNDGKGFLDFIPPEAIVKMRHDTMTINLANGSIIRLVGSDSYDTSIVGSNPVMVVFSEYALCDENAYKLAVLPIIRANDGIVALISTPRGKNHMYELYQIAMNSPDWHVEFRTIDDTGHISADEVRKEIESGEISEDLALQEYWCSFEMGQEGSYYAKYIDKMHLKGQIGTVTWEPYHKVFTAWDLGIKDPTVIIFFQVIGETIRIFDYYEAADKPMSHFAQVIHNKKEEGYLFAKHFGPHDLAARESARGLTKRELYAELGVKFWDPVKIGIEDGIELVRRNLGKMWIDSVKCKKFIKHIENYREEFDIKRKIYKGRPLHDHTSHACFTGDTLILTRSGMRQIIDIEENEEVLTLSGWQKCTKSFKTIEDANLVEVKFTDGTIVKCTRDHLFLTTKGWRFAKNLMTNTKIRSSLMNLPSTLMDLCLDYGQMRDILLKVDQNFTEKYGNSLLETYRKIVIYTTKTMIPLTIISGISNALTQKSIYHFLDQITEDLAMLLGQARLNGISQILEDCGIKDRLKDLNLGLNGNDSQGSAFTVNQSLHALYVEMDMHKNFATRTAKHLTIASVKSLQEKQDVYDITVPVIGHFSLSNGAIVHNSDALRYLCAALPHTREGISAAELDRRYNEAMYGNDLPPMFNDKWKTGGFR